MRWREIDVKAVRWTIPALGACAVVRVEAEVDE